MSAQAKAISEIVKDFEQSLETYRPSTRRVYVAGARAAIRAASLELWQSPSTNELLASTRAADGVASSALTIATVRKIRPCVQKTERLSTILGSAATGKPNK